ncbi:MAG: HAMP domain-containing histidine kinase [Acidimicrobiia bacterium]|nr:HAMP domain-containing histidine kinase [Acidimicrobiia bacterium]
MTSGGSVFGAVRITFPAGNLESRIRRNTLSLGLLAAVVMLSTAGIGALLARSVHETHAIAGGAVATVLSGDLTARAPVDAGPHEVRTLARQFNDMASRLEELLRAQRAFVADASHELRTPLTALRLRIENLASADPVEMRRDVEQATEEIGRLARLVEGLLALARTEGARPERGQVDVAREAAERVGAWQALAEEQGVALTLESDGVARALVVPGAIAQVLDNLLANALEVAPEGSTVTVRAARADGRVELHVIDEGPGLSEEERTRAFDRFWRAAGSAPGHGSGLGLAIVAQLAGACGGTAQIAPAPGTGCDAYVSLPHRLTPPPLFLRHFLAHSARK